MLAAFDEEVEDGEELRFCTLGGQPFEGYVKLNRKIPPEVQSNVSQLSDLKWAYTTGCALFEH